MKDSFLYSYLTNADMKLGTIHDEENKEVELNESNFSRYIRSKDRRVREESFEKLYESYAGVKNTIASLYGSILKYDSINAKLRGYTSSLESYLNPNNIPTALYNNLIKTISDNLEPLYEYFELKKKMLGLDEFHLYDLGNLDESSLYKPRTKAKPIKNVEAEIVEELPQENVVRRKGKL